MLNDVPMDNSTLTALPGVRVGHSTHLDLLTGCTVILFDERTPVAYQSYGGTVGSFNTEGLRAGKTYYKVDAIFIAGGSAAGLIAAAPIVECLRRDGHGTRLGPDRAIVNPSITGAVIHDQGTNLAQFDAEYGAEAYRAASTEPVPGGNLGAGTGATVGKYRWLDGGARTGAMKAGVGSARVDLGNGIVVCALSVVNAIGNIVLPNGEILAGNRAEHGGWETYEALSDFLTAAPPRGDRSNTTISVVGINVDLGATEHYERVAHLATHGHVRAINPVHTSGDGDTVFVFSTRELRSPLADVARYFQETDNDIHLQVDLLGHAAAAAIQESIYDACREAESVAYPDAFGGVIPAARDLA
jgi:L-aminopeptidase/D-esterase-like protein